MKTWIINLLVAIQSKIMFKGSKRYAAGYSYARAKFIENPCIETLDALEKEVNVDHSLQNWPYCLGMLDYMEKIYTKMSKASADVAKEHSERTLK